ncbi:MAG: hypothetical protein WA690_01165 [Candidatus Acidiferrales bacterium]
MFTQTIPLPEGGGVFEALDAGADFTGLAGAAAGAGADELAADVGVAAAGAEVDAEVELGLEPDDTALVFVLRLFFASAVDESAAAGLLEESADAGCALASAEVFFERDFFEPVELSEALVDAVPASPDADFADFDEGVFLVLPVPLAEPELAEVSVAADFDDLDFFDLLAEVPLLESAVSLAEESVAAVFVLDLLVEVPELPEEVSVALASELGDVFLVFFLLVVLLALASDC